MKRGKCSDLAADEIMLDTFAIDKEHMRELAKMYRQCTYIRAASQKLHTVALNGGLCAKIGGMIDLPYFEGRTGERIRDNLERALEWIDAYGFVPFSVDTQPSCNETTGAPIGFGSDEADALLGEGGVVGMQQQQQQLPPEKAGVTPDAGEAADAPLRPTPSSVEPSDFDFTVPSLGVGHYKVYRDASDNKRRIVYVEEDDTRPRKRRRSPRGATQRQQQQGLGWEGRKQNAQQGEEEEEEEAEPVWYVYTVEEPGEHGEISSRMARLGSRRRLLETYEGIDLSVAKMGARPPLVTQAMTPGKGLRNLDHHTGYMTDAEAVTISTKESQGMPSGFRDVLRQRDDWVRNVLEFHGIDADHGIQEATGAQGQISYNSRIPIENRRQLATVLKPTRTIDLGEKQRDYVQRVAVEFGVPPSDLTEVGMRYKPERGQHAVTLIENGRVLRHTLTDLLYQVFDLRNASRFEARVRDRMRANAQYMRDLKAVVAQTRQMIEAARAAALKPNVASGDEDDDDDDDEDSGDKGDKKAPEPDSNNAGDDDDDASAGLNMAPGCGYPSEAADGGGTPQSVQDLVAWVGQVENSYAHIGRVQAALDRMVKQDRPIDISWKQPLVADSSAVEHTAKELRLDDAQRASLARFYYGLQM